MTNPNPSEDSLCNALMLLLTDLQSSTLSFNFCCVCCIKVKSVVMINCGGCLNVLELLQPDEDIHFYIVDRYVFLYQSSHTRAPMVGQFSLSYSFIILPVTGH